MWRSTNHGYCKLKTNNPWTTIKSIIRKWKKHGTTANLPRERSPLKLRECAMRALMREATKSIVCIVIVEELERSTAPVHRTRPVWPLWKSGEKKAVAERKKS